MKKRLLSLALAFILILALCPAFAAGPAVDTDQASYTAGDTVNVLLSAPSDLMLEVFRGSDSDGTKLISGATSNKTYSFKTGTDWQTGTYTIVVGAGSNRANCVFSLTAPSGGGTPVVEYVYLSVYGPDSALLENKRITFAAGLSAFSLVNAHSGLDVVSAWSAAYGGYYVSAISGSAELDHGEMSGWLYSVNGSSPGVSASGYTLSPGDRVLWFYTEDGSAAMYSPASGGGLPDPILPPAVTDPKDVPAAYLFEDVDAGAWYAEHIRFVREKGLMSGTSQTAFSPDLPMSRAMLITVLHRMAASPEATYKSVFSDISDSSAWYYEATLWAAENKIAEGHGNGLFGPGDYITREQAGAILCRYAKYKGYDTSDKGAGLGGYTDRAKISPWAYPALEWAVSKGIIKGRGALLSPAASLTRCEAAAIIARFFEAYEK